MPTLIIRFAIELISIQGSHWVLTLTLAQIRIIVVIEQISDINIYHAGCWLQLTPALFLILQHTTLKALRTFAYLCFKRIRNRSVEISSALVATFMGATRQWSTIYELVLLIVVV